jgi:hypothetical protein
MSSILPPMFVEWQPFVAHWSAAEGDARLRARLASTEQERQEFFDTCFPRTQAALDYLDSMPMSSWAEPEHNLMNLLLNLAHVALAVETQGDAETHHARFAKFMTYTKTPRVAQ